jgi:Flp pilus assembly protein TadB
MSVSVLEALKNNWRELADGTPGKRFQNRYEKKQRSGESGRGRALKLAAAALLIAVGIVLLVVPGPGSVLIVLGAALLAEESSRVARWLDRTEVRIRRLFRRR